VSSKIPSCFNLTEKEIRRGRPELAVQLRGCRQCAVTVPGARRGRAGPGTPVPRPSFYAACSNICICTACRKRAARAQVPSAKRRRSLGECEWEGAGCRSALRPAARSGMRWRGICSCPSVHLQLPLRRPSVHLEDLRAARAIVEGDGRRDVVPASIGRSPHAANHAGDAISLDNRERRAEVEHSLLPVRRHS